MLITDAISENYADLAQKIDETLQAMQGELDASMNPHRTALRALKSTRFGWTELAYSPDALRAISDLLRKDPSDLEAVHRMAIMRHARAIDLEAEKDARQSDADWEAAAKHWYMLWQSDDFWNQIAEKACRNAKRDAVDSLRQRFPELFLGIQYEIAFHPETKNYRARYHIQSVLQAPFPKESKDNVRRQVYERHVAALPASIWNTDMLDPAVIQNGLSLITKFLELDPHCVPALSDALRLENRLLIARYGELRAVGDDEQERGRLLSLIRQSADTWFPYFSQLSDACGELEDDVRQKLCLWFRVMGDVLCGANKREEAINYFELGLKCSTEEDEERQICTNSLGEAHAYIAREHAHDGKDNAKAYCDQVRARTGLSVTAHFMLANAYQLLHEFDIAESICQSGLAVEPDMTDLDAIEEHERDRVHLSKMLESIKEDRRRYEVRQMLDKAQEQIKEGNFAEALSILVEAGKKGRELVSVYFLRIHCYSRLDRYDEAQADLAAIKKLAGLDMQEEIGKMEESVKDGLALQAKFGRDGMRLRREAIKRHNSNDFGGAVELLRKAVAGCPAQGKNELKGELAAVLVSYANYEVDEIVKKGASPTEQIKVCNKAVEHLEEAHKLAPGNENANSSLQELNQFIQKLDVDVKLGPDAAKLRQEAIKKFNKGSYAEAEEMLREALSKAPIPGKALLNPELANVLCRRAVYEANKALEGSQSAGQKLIVCRRACGYVEEAQILDPSNDNIKVNLQSLRNAIDGLQQDMQIEEMARDFGGEKVLKLRSDAIKAFNQRDFFNAVKHLRSALAACGYSKGKSQLEKELSMALSACAVEMVNAMGSRVTLTLIDSAISMLEEAAKLDPTNQQAETNLEMLQSIKWRI